MEEMDKDMNNFLIAQSGAGTAPTATPEPRASTSTAPAPVPTITPIINIPAADALPTAENNTSYTFFTIAALALIAGIATLLWQRFKKSDNDESKDACAEIKLKRDQKEKELSAVSKQFSLQETLLKKLSDELEEKKEAMEAEVQKVIKDKVLETIKNKNLNVAVGAAERTKEIYEDAKEKYDRAKSLLQVLRAKRERIAGELSSLDVSYKQCMLNQATTLAKVPPAKKIELPKVSGSVFIFHGTSGYPEENWFPWLKRRLEERGYRVFVPKFPTPQGQSLAAWFKVLEKYGEYFDENTILIGHSLGGMFLLRILERLEYKIKAAVFVGTPIGIEPIANYSSDYDFSGFNFKWDKIKNKAQHFIVFHSDNDPYVDLANGQELAQNLGAKLSLVPNAGHFNKKAGYTKFEELYKQIIKLN